MEIPNSAGLRLLSSTDVTTASNHLHMPAGMDVFICNMLYFCTPTESRIFEFSCRIGFSTVVSCLTHTRVLVPMRVLVLPSNGTSDWLRAGPSLTAARRYELSTHEPSAQEPSSFALQNDSRRPSGEGPRKGGDGGEGHTDRTP